MKGGHKPPRSLQSKEASLAGPLGGMSLVEIHLLQRRGQQPGISMFVGSIPQHNTLPHQDSKESMFCKMGLPTHSLQQESVRSLANQLPGQFVTSKIPSRLKQENTIT